MLGVAAGGTSAALAAPSVATFPTTTSYSATAEYFGDASPLNLWSSDLSGAANAFRQMQQDGFNTVGLVIPWGFFQPGIQPAIYNATAFSRLDRLISIAGSLHMAVILRLGYGLDSDPQDQLPGTRFESLFESQSVYQSWLGFISRVHQSVQHFSNVRGAYVSWEDYWTPIELAEAVTMPSQGTALASGLGYTAWLQSHYSLAQVSQSYGTTFTSWTQVPTPLPTQPSFSLMYEFEDWLLVNRIFLPAAQRFPGLTMETRVDVDPIFNGAATVGSYTHSTLYQLPGTTVTGMYFSPYQGDPSSSPDETAAQALDALQSTLARMSSQSGGRSLYIYEYEITSNSPQVSGDPELTASQLPLFVTQSEPILQHSTSGYALWTYRDFNLSPLFNPSFTLGTAGWSVHGSARVVTTGGTASLALGQDSSVTQTVTSQATSTADMKATTSPTVSFEAFAGRGGSVAVQWATGASQTVSLQPGWHSYEVMVPPATSGELSVDAHSAIRLTNVQLYSFTQHGDVYDTSGNPQIATGPLSQLNHQLTGTAAGSAGH